MRANLTHELEPDARERRQSCEFAATRFEWLLLQRQPHRKRNQFGDGLNSQLFHHLMTASFDGSLSGAKLKPDLLVHFALDDKIENLPLTSCQGLKQFLHRAQLGFALETLALTRERYRRHGFDHGRLLEI
jgi:hypothetical protein